MLDKLRKFYSPPHFEGDEKLSLTAFSLHFTLFGSGVIIAAYLFTTLIFNPSLFPRSLLIATIFPIILLSRWLMHQRRVQLASLLFVISLFSIMTSQALINGGVHAPAFDGLFLVVLAAYLLLGFRSSVVFTLLTLITGAGFIVAERYGWIFPTPPAQPSVSFFIAYSIYLVGGLALVYLTSRTVGRSLIQAQHAYNLKQAAITTQCQSEIRYRAIVEDQTEFINRFTLDGTVLFVNEAYARLFNKRPEELIGQSQKSFMSERGLKVLAEAQSKLSPDNPVTMDTYRFNTADGDERWFQWRDRLICDENGKPLEYQGVGRDITEQKRSQIALQESEERFRAIFEHSPSPIAIALSESRQFVNANPAFCDMVGYSLEELREKTWDQITHPDDVDRDLAGVRSITNGTSPLFSSEKRYIKKSGEIVWADIRASAIQDQHGTPLYGIAVGNDITAQKQSETALQKQLSELTTLQSVSSVVLKTLDEDEIIERVTEIIGDLLYPDHFGILLLDEGSDELWLHPSYHGLPPEFLGLRIKRGEGISGQALQAQKPMRYDDVLEVGNFIRSTPGIRSAISVPLSVSGHLFGVLNAESKQVGFFSDNDERVLVTITELLATAIERARLFKASQSLAQELESLYKAALATSRLVEPQQFLAYVYEEVQRSIPLDRFFVLLHHEENDELEIALAIEEDVVREEKHGQRYSINSGIPSAWVVQHGETLLVPDIASSEFPTMITTASGKIPKSLMSVPLIYGERVIGAICIQSFQSHTYNKDHQRFLEALAPQVSTTFINDQLFLAEKQQRTMAEALKDTAMVIGSTLDFKEVLERILASVGRVVPHDAANIMIIDEGYLKTRIIASRGYESVGITHEELTASKFPFINSPLFEHMIQARQPIAVSDVRADENWIRFPETAWVHSYLGAPIIIEDTVIGFVNLYSARENFFDSTHSVSLEAFANQVAIAIENAKLYEELEKHSVFLEQEIDFATEELKQSKDRLETILDNSPNAILLLSPEGMIETSNRTFGEIFQYSNTEVLGQSLSILATTESKWECNKILKEVVVEHKPKRVEIKAANKDNATFDVELSLVPLQHDGIVYGIVSTVRDISALKEVEHMKDEFVSNVSHELRTPITSLKLNHSLMKLDPQKQDVYLGRLGREIERLNKLIEDLLRLSRLDQDSVQLERATIDLNDLVAQIVEDRLLIAKESGLTLTFNAQEDLVAISADPGLFGQVLNILLTNAINYTPSGRSISVSTHTKKSDGVQWAGFRVSDMGAGISSDDLPHLFDRFYRGKAGRASGVPGTGLGLAIAKEIVERHQGYIEVASEGQGKGTSFSAWFPMTVD